MRCNYCDKEINSLCHLGRCNKYKLFLDENLSYDKMYKMYVIDGMSALEISQVCNISNAGSIINRLKKLGIPTRNIKESVVQIRSSNKRKATNIDRYGAYNTFCRDSSSRKEWQDRLLKEEGIVNVFQRDNVKKKSVITLLEKYGVETPSNITTSRGSNVYSSIHKLVVNILNELGIDFTIEFKIKKNNITYYSFDILLSNSNKIIEVNGDYWHGNPLIYKPTDLILRNSSGETAVWIKWEKDREKINFALKSGYSVLVIWESELKHNHNIKDVILEYATS